MSHCSTRLLLLDDSGSSTCVPLIPPLWPTICSSLGFGQAKEDLVMLVELSVVEQRYDAVREVLDGASVKDVAIRYRVDRIPRRTGRP
jgi:hypothetical protein